MKKTNKAVPALSIFWADTMVPLTYHERNGVTNKAKLVSLTPYEVLLEIVVENECRKIAIVSVEDKKGREILKKAKII